MALTNYPLHSVAFVLLFYSYGLGLGLYAKVGAFGGVMLALPVLAIEFAVSRWWLRRFRLGPAEWLWRSLASGKSQPLRVIQPLVGSSAG